ncbi:hypothetical protein D3C78_449900 [compost metagenome]
MKTLTFTAEQLIEAMQNVKGFYDMSAELIVEQIFSDAADAACDEKPQQPDESFFDNPVQMAWAYYYDLTAVLGEAPGMKDAFESLLEYLDENDDSEKWHAHMIGFGLAMTCDLETRCTVHEMAAIFLCAAFRGDFQ